MKNKLVPGERIVLPLILVDITAYIGNPAMVEQRSVTKYHVHTNTIWVEIIGRNRWGREKKMHKVTNSNNPGGDATGEFVKYKFFSPFFPKTNQ